MIENIIIVIIVGACVLLLARSFFKKLKSPGCGCQDCDVNGNGAGPCAGQHPTCDNRPPETRQNGNGPHDPRERP